MTIKKLYITFILFQIGLWLNSTPWMLMNERDFISYSYYTSNQSILEAKSDLGSELNSRPILTDGLNALPPGKKGELMKDLGSITDATHRQVLMDVLNSKPKGIEAWDIALKHSDIVRLDVDFINNLATHLDEFPNLKLDLDDLDVFNGYKDFAYDEVLSYEILNNVDGNLALLIAQKVQNSTVPSFWKYLIKGTYFERDFLLPKFKDRFNPNGAPAEYLQLKSKAAAEFNGLNLDEYDMYSQVQFNLPNSVTLPSGRVLEYFVADQVFIKWKKVNNIDVVDDVVIIENKLSFGTPLTPPQNAGKAANSLVVRSQNATNASPVYGKPLTQGVSLNSNNKWLKAYDSENGDELTDIEKL